MVDDPVVESQSQRLLGSPRSRCNGALEERVNPL